MPQGSFGFKRRMLLDALKGVFLLRVLFISMPLVDMYNKYSFTKAYYLYLYKVCKVYLIFKVFYLKLRLTCLLRKSLGNGESRK